MTAYIIVVFDWDSISITGRVTVTVAIGVIGPVGTTGK